MIVRFHKNALNNISEVANYITDIYKAPKTALKFIDSLLVFATMLGETPHAYTL